jgi:hypothetical protein
MLHEFVHGSHVVGDLEQFLVETEQIPKRSKIENLYHGAELSSRQVRRRTVLWLLVLGGLQMTERKTGLGRDVYLALAAVGWADGQLDQDEADAIVRTALEEGLGLDEIAEIEAATKNPIDIGVIDRKKLSKEDRLFVYGVASWITRLDGVVTVAEQAALEKLGEALKVPEKPRALVDGIAQDVANLSDDRPDRYDLLALRRIIGERLALGAEKHAN